MLKHLIYILLISVVFIESSNLITAEDLYSGDRTYIFKAHFVDTEGDTTKRDTLKLKTTNEKLFSQNKIIWILETDDYQIESETGAIERKNKIWIHPPRFDDYVEFTEYSAFPEVQFPINKNDSWESTLTLMDYATEESGPIVEVKYNIISIDTLNLDPLNRKVRIIGKGTTGLGTYTNEYIYTDKQGFTEFIYTKSNGDKLIIRYVDELIMRGFMDH